MLRLIHQLLSPFSVKMQVKTLLLILNVCLLFIYPLKGVCLWNLL